MLAQGRRRVQLGMAVSKVPTGSLDPFVVHRRASSGQPGADPIAEPLPILTAEMVLMFDREPPNAG